MATNMPAQIISLEKPVLNTRIQSIQAISTPAEIQEEIPVNSDIVNTILSGRNQIERIMTGKDNRLMIIVGPCSIHDQKSAIEYAERLKRLNDSVCDKLMVVMRVYFEKPRTTVGWKGLINDPQISQNGSGNLEEGYRLARHIMFQISEIGLPIATEFLDPVTPQYIGDLVAWGAIGARTAESQSHREMASGLSCPVGFKNGTTGSIKIAVDAMCAARESHTFMAITDNGRCGFARSTGNDMSQVILRGGTKPNYFQKDVSITTKHLRACGLNERIIIDCSHANAGKDYHRQSEVLQYVLDNHGVNYPVYGVMLESHLVEGKQPVGPLPNLTYGQSITDGCIGWGETESLIKHAHSNWSLV